MSVRQSSASVRALRELYKRHTELNHRTALAVASARASRMALSGAGATEARVAAIRSAALGETTDAMDDD